MWQQILKVNKKVQDLSLNKATYTEICLIVSTHFCFKLQYATFIRLFFI